MRQADGRICKKSLPPLAVRVHQAGSAGRRSRGRSESLENLPYGLDGANYQWVDLDGEGLSGILTEQAGGWFYKRNLSPIICSARTAKEDTEARFAPLELVAKKPSFAALSGGRQQFWILPATASSIWLTLSGPTPGFYERTQDEDWETFRPFISLPNIEWNDPNLKFVDLTGDGHADMLITEDEVFWWYPVAGRRRFRPRGAGAAELG